MTPSPDLKLESLWIPVNAEDTLHLMRIRGEQPGPVVFLLHGSIENGRVFYTLSGKGLAPYLARAGYDVYVADLRGRGLSKPPVGPQSNFGQTQAITEDIPAFLAKIHELRGETPQHWIAHSWGGVLLHAFLARFPERVSGVQSMVCFGSKRVIRVFNWEKFWKVNLFWNGLAPLLTRVFGYLPTKGLLPGADNESRKSHAQCIPWVKPGAWIDPEDGFNYGAKILEVELPPVLHLTGEHDRALGHPRDVYDFLRETGAKRVDYRILGRARGFRHNYNHLNILTHPSAVEDHFPLVLRWLEKQSLK